MDPASVLTTTQDTDRVVHRHDDAAHIDEVARAIQSMLDRGDAVIWVGTDTGLRWVAARLTMRGVDVMAARMNRRLRCLDASCTLNEIVVDGSLDTERFAEVIGAQLDASANRFARVAVFVEIVTSASPTGAAFEALLKSFAQSRAVFAHRGYRTPACRCKPTPGA